MLLRKPPHVEKLGKTRLSVIGPAKKHLERLREDYREWLEQQPGGGGNIHAVPTTGEPSVDASAGAEPHPFGPALSEQVVSSIIAAAEIIVTTDPTKVTPPNRASITLLAEESKRTCLLTGDAAEEEILEGLEAAGRIVNGRFWCNVVKVQHHGSENNLSQTFSGTVLADHYILCADGNHKNPDPSVVKTIAETRVAADPRPFTIWFNCSPERTLATAARRCARRSSRRRPRPTSTRAGSPSRFSRTRSRSSRSSSNAQGMTWTGVPSRATRASSRMPTLGMRMQPWERALPSGSARLDARAAVERYLARAAAEARQGR